MNSYIELALKDISQALATLASIMNQDPLLQTKTLGCIEDRLDIACGNLAAAARGDALTAKD